MSIYYSTFPMETPPFARDTHPFLIDSVNTDTLQYKKSNFYNSFGINSEGIAKLQFESIQLSKIQNNAESDTESLYDFYDTEFIPLTNQKGNCVESKFEWYFKKIKKVCWGLYKLVYKLILFTMKKH